MTKILHEHLNNLTVVWRLCSSILAAHLTPPTPTCWQANWWILGLIQHKQILRAGDWWPSEVNECPIVKVKKKKCNGKYSYHGNCTFLMLIVIFCSCFTRLSYRASCALARFVCLVSCAASNKKGLLRLIRMASGVVGCDQMAAAQLCEDLILSEAERILGDPTHHRHNRLQISCWGRGRILQMKIRNSQV